MFESVVVVFAIVLDADRLAQVAEFNYDLRIVVLNFNGRDIFDDGVDFLQDIGYQNRVIGGQVTTRFLDNCRMRDVFVVTDLLDGIDDVIGKFLRRVICRRVKGRF